MELQREGTIHSHTDTPKEDKPAPQIAEPTAEAPARAAGVRFAAQNEEKEFSPDDSVEQVQTITADGGKPVISPSDQEELKRVRAQSLAITSINNEL